MGPVPVFPADEGAVRTAPAHVWGLSPDTIEVDPPVRLLGSVELESWGMTTWGVRDVGVRAPRGGDGTTSPVTASSNDAHIRWDRDGTWTPIWRMDVDATVSSEAASPLEAAAGGDEVAFRRIVAEHHDDMRRVARYITRDAALADEATQAAWLIAWRKLGNVRDEARLRPWLVSVTANEAKRFLHGRRRAEVAMIADPAPATGTESLEVGIAAMDLRAALGRLDPDDRALLAMRYIAGFDSNELAIAIGISPSGVRNRLERIRSRLRKELG
jgi:RNA polymerase sigma factor (sigma-70 family)